MRVSLRWIINIINTPLHIKINLPFWVNFTVPYWSQLSLHVLVSDFTYHLLLLTPLLWFLVFPLLLSSLWWLQCCPLFHHLGIWGLFFYCSGLVWRQVAWFSEWCCGRVIFFLHSFNLLICDIFISYGLKVPVIKHEDTFLAVVMWYVLNLLYNLPGYH